MTSAVIRNATAADAAQIAHLLGLLGYDVTPAQATHRLAILPPDTDPVWVAERDAKVVGLIALHRGPMLHVEGETARITVLVTDPAARREGIAAALVARAREWAAGCPVLEVTTGLAREDAHQFYRAQGFECSALRFKHGPGK